jgi:hypothetical protein
MKLCGTSQLDGLRRTERKGADNQETRQRKRQKAVVKSKEKEVTSGVLKSIPTAMKRAWIGVASKDHVLLGVNGHFVQVCHGKGGSLRKMKAGDAFVYYSPTITFGGKDKLQAFTAIGTVRTGEVYQFEMSSDFKPFRCDVDFFSAKETPISLLKPTLLITQGNWDGFFGEVTSRYH